MVNMNSTSATKIRTAIDLPTWDMIEHFRAFGDVDLNPALCTQTVYSPAGNVIVPVGATPWVNGHIWDDEFVSAWTADTHYAGIKSSAVPADSFVGVDHARMYCGWNYVAVDASGNRIERYRRSFTELVVEHSNLIVCGYRVTVEARATGEIVPNDCIVPSWMLKKA